jgi:hypothetical protein
LKESQKIYRCKPGSGAHVDREIRVHHLLFQRALQAALATRPVANARTALETMEHLALLKRWFYRSTRSGEIFVADPKSGLPLRRLVRGIARVYRGEKPEAEKIDHRVTGPS